MTGKPELRPEILLFNRVLVYKSRHGGWTVGEPYSYADRDREVVRPSHHVDIDDAVGSALSRAMLLAGEPQGGGLAQLLQSLLGTSTKILAPVLTRPGELLLRLREEGGLSQQSVAELAGVSLSTVWRIERGLVSPRADTLLRIFTALQRAGLSP